MSYDVAILPCQKQNPLTEIVLVDSLTNVSLADGKLKLIVLDICSGGVETPTDNTLYQHFVNITIILHTKNNTTPTIPDWGKHQSFQIWVTRAAPNIYLKYYYNLAAIDRQY